MKSEIEHGRYPIAGEWADKTKYKEDYPVIKESWYYEIDPESVNFPADSIFV